MGKGKTFGGLGIGLVLSTVAGIFVAKKKTIFLMRCKRILEVFQDY